MDLAAETATEVPATLADETRTWLALAGDRAMRLDVARAYDYFHRALELTPLGHPDRPEIITKVVQSGRRAGRMASDEAETLMLEAVEQLRSAGDLRAAGRAMVRRSRQLGVLGETTTARAVLNEAIEILEREPRGLELADAYAARAEEEMMAGWPRDCLEWADRALGLLGGIGGSAEIRVMAYQLRGIARCELGDTRGLEDLSEALQIAYELGLALEAAQARTYLGEAMWQLEGPAQGLGFHEQAVEQCLQRGLTSEAMWARGETVWMLYDLGRWDEALERADEVSVWDREHASGYLQAIVGPYRARILLDRGRDPGTIDLEEVLRFARQFKDLQALAPALASGALVAAAAGDWDRAIGIVEEFEHATRGRSGAYREAHLPDLVQVCLEVERPDLADVLVQGAAGVAERQRHCLATARALLAEAREELEDALGSFEAASQGWAAFGSPFERARADLGAARVLHALGRDEPAAERLAAARATFGELAATAWSERARLDQRS
jgi:tetratricopeptide (TPR) repeat protein